MIFAPCSRWTLGLFCGFALCSNTAFAQDRVPERNQRAFDEVNTRLSKESRGIPKEDLETIKPLFLQFAKYYADLVTSPAVYKAYLDPKTDPRVRIPTFDRNSQTGVLLELDRYILDPNPTTKVSTEKLDYIREIGIAFDTVLKPIIETHPERIVRINATRILAEVCRSGAAALWPTVTNLLVSKNTPPEVKLYALHAAANLLAAYDPNEYANRKHFNEPKEVGTLVQAITNCILIPTDILSGLKAGEVTPDQLDVIGFIRRHAVRALGQVRFVTIPGSDGKQPIYPVYTLARICVSDPVFMPAPSPGECADAVLGICNMATSFNNNPFKGYNPDAIVEAVAAGMKTFSAPRAADAADRSLPWRSYSIKLTEALKNWQPLFDPTFLATRPNSFDESAVPASVKDLIGRLQNLILAPMDKLDFKGNPDPNAVVDVGALERFVDQLRTNPNRKPLVFTNNPDTLLYSPVGK
jgi:hypothetical protein